MSGWNLHNPSAAHCADKHLAFDNIFQIHQCHIAEFTSFLNPQLHDFHTAFCKCFPLQEARIADQPFNLARRLFFRIHHKRKGIDIPHGKNLLAVFGITDSCNGVNSRIQTMGSHTTEQIDFIRTGGCNEQIRLFHIRTLQHAHGGTVSLYPHNIVTLHTRIQHTLVRIDQSQVVSCRRKLLRQRESDLAITGDYYFHRFVLRLYSVFRRPTL